MSFLPLLAALAFVLSPLVSGSFGGFDPNAFPIPQDDPPVQPAGWAFSIWGIIYLWLLVHGVFGAVRRGSDPAWAPMRLPLTVSLGIGAFWIPVANASPIWASVMIWAMLATAILAFLRTPAKDPLTARAPLGLYAGWLTAASSVSLGLLAAGYGLTGPLVAAWGALALAVGLGLLVHLRRPSRAYPFAIGWAAAGISFQNMGLHPVLAVAAGLVALAALIPWFRRET
ncbi:hypothetical protein [Palleronia sp. LCG004]|uniref:hypothetical protein n=1 Tax=Palleronia sp. LCG004 TaxID=3079304 RepID=UPI002943A29C|nr:hypothetical protein [Palleronia sp. LCG004]WOI54861.1 hypothetical protein RVY76_07235 [Palleronia sp. LCG004]